MSTSLAILSLMVLIHQTNTQIIDCNGDCECPSASSPATCTLNCIGKDQCKDGTLKCRAGDPCIVNCVGENSCEGNSFIDASAATDVSISCIGTTACKGNTVMNCGTKSCEITCDSSTSCQGATVDADSATGFVCTGSCGSFNTVPSPFTMQTTPPTVQTSTPTETPTLSPTSATSTPTAKPTSVPTLIPTKNPTFIPTQNPTLIPTKHPALIPTDNPTLIPTKTPTLHQTQYPTLMPTENPFALPSFTRTQPPSRVATLPSITTSNPTMNPSMNPTFRPTVDPLRDAWTTTQETDDSEEVETVLSTKTEAQTESAESIRSTYSIGTNPMWYIVMASAGLIICGSVICCVGIFCYYKQTRAVLVERKEFEQKELQKVSSGGSTPGGEMNANEATYKDADAEKDGYVLTVPPALQPGASIFVENGTNLDVEANDIDNINNDIVVNTNDGINIDIHESESTPLPDTDSDEESSASVKKDANTGDGDAIMQWQPPYNQSPPVCGVMAPGFYDHSFNVMTHQIPQGLVYQNGQYIPYVTIPQGSASPHMVSPGIVVSPSLPPPPPLPSQ